MQIHSESHLYHIAKTVTTLLVVIGHSAVMYTSYGAFDPINDSGFLAALTDYIYSFHMPLFVFLSGAVYGHCIDHGKYDKCLPFAANKARRLLIPYLAFGLLYVAPVMCLLGLTEQTFWEYSYSGILLSGNSRHLWYLPALFWIFLLAIPAKPLLTHSRWGRMAVLLLSAALFEAAQFVPGQFQLYMACHYQLYFFLGVIFHYSYGQFAKFAEKFRYWFVPLPFILLGQLWFNPNYITTMLYRLIGISMMLGISFLLARYWGKWSKNRWCRILWQDSFGIYLFHPMIIYVLYYCLGSLDIPPLALCFGAVAVALIGSVLATWGLRKMGLKILLGE